MKRREFIAALGGTVTLTFPSAVQAQQPKMPVVGYLGSRSGGSETIFEAFRRGLKEAGFTEGQNVVIDDRWPQLEEHMPAVAAALVKDRVSVIVSANNPGALAAKAATSEIPIVFAVGLDPVQMGLVAAINRPGGNATGVAFRVSALEPKRFELLRQLLPRVQLAGVLVNPENPNFDVHVKELQSAAATSGLQLLILRARNVVEIESAFVSIVEKRADALLVTSDRMFQIYRKQLAELAERRAVPTIYPWRDFVDVGGLMSYGNSLIDTFRQVGVYTGRILKGDKVSDLPVWQPTRFEFVINLKAAKKLGFEVPPALLTFADEVIE
jgi:putative tryptophan/tyrosine transport system substrate-binding protein